MGIRERLLDAVDYIKGRRPEAEFKEGSLLHIDFWDLRKKEKAQEHHVPPGYYVTVDPISPEQISDPNLLYKLNGPIMAVLLKQAPADSKVRIPVDNEGNFLSPDNTWRLSPHGYLRELSMFVVQAERVEPFEAQKRIISQMRRT